MNTLLPLQELINQAIAIVEEIRVHPEHQKLLDDGYQPDVTITDALQALTELDDEI